jgi:hypothetical protein
MSSRVHTPECEQQMDRTESAQKAWQSRWPGHCVRCKGTGIHHLGEYYLQGAELPCAQCVCKGTCARCGTPEPSLVGLVCLTRFGPCRACGWNHDDALPEFACLCRPQPSRVGEQR